MSLRTKSDTKTLSDYLSKQGRQSLQSEKAAALSERVRASPGLIRNRKYHQFQEKYRGNLGMFARDCFMWDEGKGPGSKGPTDYQIETLQLLEEAHRVSVRGPHTLGKTALASWAILGFALTHDGEDWKVPTTASVWRQLTKFLWPEIHKWARQLRWDIIGREPFNTRTELQTQNLRLSTGEAFALASDNHMAIEGAHADYLLYVFDEGKAIPDKTWDAAEGAFAGGGDEGAQVAKALAISTPGEPIGRFYDIHARRPGYEDWYVRHVTTEEAIAAGRLTTSWVEQRRDQWGEGSALFQNRVVGEFASSDEDSIIPLGWVELANQRYDAWQDAMAEGGVKGRATSGGCDVGLGGEGGDSTIIALVFDENRVDELRVYQRGSADTATMQTAGHVKGVIDNFGCDVYIDVIGIGVGVYNRLREQKIKRALPFNAAEKTRPKLRDITDEYSFRNKRAAMWWLGREMLDPQNGYDIALPRDDKLTNELITPHYDVKSNAVIQVESKKDIRKRINRSTDRADAVLQALCGPRIAKRAPTDVYVVGHGHISS
jgi:hypothetical protein